jgi:flagellar capping protein FliD
MLSRAHVHALCYIIHFLTFRSKFTTNNSACQRLFLKVGSDLQLTGLASGFDWKPVVEQLVALEGIPKQRLQSEKSANEEKVSDLGLLKSQLDALNGAASALNNDDLYEARKVGMDSTSAAILSATASAGALTGEFVVSVYSIGTQTEMSSKNRVPGGLGAGLDLSKKLNELPLQSKISTGTFTIAGKTLSIDNLDVTLQSIIDEINTTVAVVSGVNVSGVNPEGDTTGVTFEYDAINDRMIVDGGETSPNALNAVPILGSPTDTSNFLQVLRLLNRASVTRDADLEVGSGISVYGTGNNSGTSAWLRLDDGDETALNSTDPRMFASDGNIIYKRVAHDETLYNNQTHYTTGQKAYRNGFVYEVKAGKNLPNATGNGNGHNWDKTITGVGQDAWYGSQHWKLLIDLSTSRIGNGTGNADFTAAVDAGHHGVNLGTNATTANNKAIKAGDIVKAQDGEYYRAIQDRTSSTAVAWNNYATDHSSGLAAVAAGADSAKWANNLPISIYNNGRMFAIKSGFTATEHAGAADATIYNTANGWNSTSKLVVGNRGVATAKVNYYLPKTGGSGWGGIATHTGIGDVSGYGNAKVVKSGSNFFEAQMDFSAIGAVANNFKYTQGTEVKDAGGNNYYEAGSNWAAVLDKTTGADPFGRTTAQYVQIGGASGDFFKPKQNFNGTNFPTYDNTQYYNGTGTREVKSGSNYYIRTANSKVADVNNNASTTITGTQLTTAIGASTTFFVNTGTVYTPNSTLTGIAAHNAGTAYDVSGGAIYASGGTNQIYQADSNFKGSFTNSSSLAQNEILKDGGGNWYQINDLSSFGNWDGTSTNYSQNDIVQDTTDSSRYYKKTSAGTLNAAPGNSAPSADATHWTLATASDLGSDVNTNATTLGSALWSDVTSTFTNLANTTGWTAATAAVTDADWTNINSKVKDPGTGGLDYWSNETSTLGNPATGGNWWTDRTTVIGTPSNDGTYWSNKTSDINNLAVVDGAGGDFAEDYWQKVDLAAPGAGGGDNTYWEEKGFIKATNSATSGNHDVNYWQRVLPNMKRYDGTASQLTSIDYSIWAKAGNVNAVIGDTKHANHDGGEHPTGSTFTFTAWNSGTTYTGGEYVEQGGKVYQARGTAGTNNNPSTASNNDKWSLIADTVAEARKHVYVDTDYWDQVDIGSNLASSNYWEKMQETVIQSSQALGTIDMTVSLASSNFGVSLSASGSGLGNFFIGEGEGAVRIDYNVNNDTVANLVDRVNASDANVHMYYDPVSDRFVVRNKEAGSVGITLHQSSDWDALSANSGNGNILNAMGLTAPALNLTTPASAVYNDYNPANHGNYANGTYVSLGGIGGDPATYWQALKDTISEGPSTASTQWRQVIPSVGRSMVDELGQNSTVKVNQGDLIYSNKTIFTDAEHGYEGITFDISQAAVNDSASFVVARDSSQAKVAIEKLVEEFNDAQDYIKSLTSVTNDGENVSAGKFSSNIEISRLGSQLRKVIFGDSTAHSESGTTSDGSNLIINARDNASSELIAIAGELNFDSNNDGYIVKVLNDNATGNPKYWKFDAGGGGGAANWTQTDPVYSSFRLSNIGLDFGIGSDRIMVKNSALLTQELETNPEKVKALFADVRVESTKTAETADLSSTPKTLNNNDANSPTATNAVVGDTIANSAAYDANTSSYRTYQGVASAIDEFISAFLSGDSDSGYKGAYNTHIESIRSQNKRIDERIEDMERYLEQREKTLSDGFMRMEEMQSQLNTQLQTLQNSFKSK